MKPTAEERPPRQMTVFIDGDLYEALLIGKARGKGSLKKQINEALRRTLRLQNVAAREEQERRGWEAKPWNEQDDAELKMWEGVQVWPEYEE